MRREAVNISTSTIVRMILIILAFLFIYYIIDILFLVFIAFVIVSAVAPLVDRLEKFKIPRFLAAALIFVSFFFLFGFFLSLIIPPVAREAGQLLEQLPSYWGKLSRSSWGSVWLGGGPGESNPFGNLKQFLGSNFSGVFFSKAGSFVIRVVYSAVVFSLAFYMTIQKNAIKKLIETMAPKEYHEYINSLLIRIQEKMGRWLSGQILLNFLIGGLVYLALSLLHIPYAPVLALAAGLLEFIPNIGPTLSTVFASLVALTVSPVMAVLTILAFVAIQQLENHLIVPLVMKKAVGLNPVVIILSLLIGVRLGGPLGAIMAVPFATALSVFLGDLFSEDKTNKKEKE
jgi:predicted PurR-regulated permease PerM